MAMALDLAVCWQALLGVPLTSKPLLAGAPPGAQYSGEVCKHEMSEGLVHCACLSPRGTCIYTLTSMPMLYVAWGVLL